MNVNVIFEIIKLKGNIYNKRNSQKEKEWMQQSYARNIFIPNTVLYFKPLPKHLQHFIRYSQLFYFCSINANV